MALCCFCSVKIKRIQSELLTGFEKPGCLTIKPNPVGFSGLTRILLGKPGEYQGLEGKGRIPTDDLIPKNRLCRNHHLMTFQIPSHITNAILIAFSLRLSGCRMILCLLSFLS